MKDPKESPGIPPGERSLAVGSPGREGPSSSSRSPETANSNGQSVHKDALLPQNARSQRPSETEIGSTMTEHYAAGAKPSETLALLAMVERVALDPRINVDTLERMMGLYERMKGNQAQQVYAEAMNQAQAEIQPVARTTENTVTHSWYAKLEAVDAAIRPIYLRHGFSLSYNTVPALVMGNVRMECRCWHTGGHSELFHREAGPDTLGPKGTPTKTVLHGIGSTETFLRRYLACGVFNVVFKDLDDDGNGGPITDEQVAEILAKIPEAKAGPKFLKYCGCLSVEESGGLENSIAGMPGKNYRKAVNALEDLIAKQGGKSADTNC